MSNGIFPASEALFMGGLHAFVRIGFAQGWRVFGSLNQAKGHWRDIVYPDITPVNGPSSTSSDDLLALNTAASGIQCHLQQSTAPVALGG